MQNPLIIWQKWVDPFGAEEDNDTSSQSEQNDPFFSTEDQEDEDDHSNHKYIDKKFVGIKAIATPMGVIPITENTASGKIFNFWIGHTNFDITKKIADTIETTEGVETLDIFTRYRFRISVGKAFNDSDVMRDINQKTYNEIEYVE